MVIEARYRSLLKAFSWRLFGTFATFVLVYIFTGKGFVALTVSGSELVSKIALYFLHERLWEKIKFGRRRISPVVVWFTGLSGAGKSTLANQVYERLLASGLKVELLDGDTIRNIFPKIGFTRIDREEHIKRVGYLASRLEAHGIFVLASFVSPYQESRNFVRSLCNNFVEIHVSTSLSVCEDRDVKGLYAKARKGEIKNFTGNKTSARRMDEAVLTSG